MTVRRMIMEVKNEIYRYMKELVAISKIGVNYCLPNFYNYLTKYSAKQ